MIKSTSTRTTRLEPPLRAVREAHGLSLREAARRADLDPAHLSKVERGLASLSIESLARLARVLGLKDLAHLLSQYERSPEMREAGFPASEPRADENVIAKDIR